MSDEVRDLIVELTDATPTAVLAVYLGVDGVWVMAGRGAIEENFVGAIGALEIIKQKVIREGTMNYTLKPDKRAKTTSGNVSSADTPSELRARVRDRTDTINKIIACIHSYWEGDDENSCAVDAYNCIQAIVDVLVEDDWLMEDEPRPR